MLSCWPSLPLDLVCRAYMRALVTCCTALTGCLFKSDESQKIQSSQRFIHQMSFHFRVFGIVLSFNFSIFFIFPFAHFFSFSSFLLFFSYFIFIFHFYVLCIFSFLSYLFFFELFFSVLWPLSVLQHTHHAVSKSKLCFRIRPCVTSQNCDVNWRGRKLCYTTRNIA